MSAGKEMQAAATDSARTASEASEKTAEAPAPETSAAKKSAEK